MPEPREYLVPLATEVIQQFSIIANEANSRLSSSRGISLESFSDGDGFNQEALRQRIATVNRANAEDYHRLATEPAIARVLVSDDKGKQDLLYICRGGGGIGVGSLVGHNAPLGRLASLEIGDTIRTPAGRVLTVLERARLRPRHEREGWDSIDTVAETETLGPVTIVSLRSLLAGSGLGEPTEDLVAQLMAEEAAAVNVIEGLRRSVIEKMGLRDQPILDKFQDEIFRLELDQRLLLLGPPGTGKTTTLIRRLGQKLEHKFLTEEERGLLEKTTHFTPVDHADSWLMFTPTELLKQYLKEAFAREGVPASDRRIKTWHSHRHDLARNAFNILKTSSGSGTFVLKENLPSLQEAALHNPTGWYEDFESWQRQAFLGELRNALQELERLGSKGLEGIEKPQQLSDLTKRLAARLNAGAETDLADKVEGLAVMEAERVHSLVAELKASADRLIRDSVNRLLTMDKNLIADLLIFLDEMKQGADTETEELEDLVSEEEELEQSLQTSRVAALNALMNALRAKARLRAMSPSRILGKTTQAGRILAWLDERGEWHFEDDVLGPLLVALANARPFQSPVKRYIDGVARRYRTYRRLRQKDGRWYHPQGFDAKEIHPLELDVVLLAILRDGTELVRRPHILNSLDSPLWASLQAVESQHHHQILVDEATDFSPVQLACMAALAHPKLRSFFACGDFNQRLTTWGTRSPEALTWAVPGLESRKITVSYRQTRQLNELAHALVLAFGGTEEIAELPKHMNAEGVSPALVESAMDAKVVGWLANRIREIERFVRKMPSTAIFVNSEAEVGPMADRLNEYLAEHNIHAMACHEGQAIGQEGDIRVFDIQHIKGLEFEAVFFVGVDRLAKERPDLFDKFLYVGATRAATYLGITCDQALPEALDSVRPLFVPKWAQAHTQVPVN